jgi:hypothetical protein
MYVFLLGSYFPFTYVCNAFFGILSPSFLEGILFYSVIYELMYDERYYSRFIVTSYLALHSQRARGGVLERRGEYLVL